MHAEDGAIPLLLVSQSVLLQFLSRVVGAWVDGAILSMGLTATKVLKADERGLTIVTKCAECAMPCNSALSLRSNWWLSAVRVLRGLDPGVLCCQQPLLWPPVPPVVRHYS
jgi:hypothetical protein